MGILVYFPPPQQCQECLREVDPIRNPVCDVCSRAFHGVTCGFKNNDVALCQACLDGDVADA